MKDIFLSFAIFLLFLNGGNSYNAAIYPNFDRCVNLRLRDIPINLKRTENGENYLNAKVHDRLRLLFSRRCVQRLTCVVYNSATNISRILTTEGTDVDYYLEDSSNGEVRCMRRNSTRMLYSFHLFVEPDDGKFFNSMQISKSEDNSLLVSCLGGYYSKDVKLLVNGKHENASYNPLRGFEIPSNKTSFNKFYQCEKDTELRSLTYPVNQSTLQFVDRFQMIKQSYFFQTELSCIIENNDAIPYEEYHVLLSCPNATACPTLTEQSSSDSKRVFSASFSKNVNIPEDQYFCVFLRGEEVIAHAFFEEYEENIGAMVIVVFIVITVALLLVILNTISRSKYNRLKAVKVHQFKELELLLENSEQIGDGNSSVIHVVRVAKSGKQVVIKYSNHSKQFSREIKMLKALKNVNIITALGTAVLPIQKLCYKSHVEHIVLPYYPQKSLEVYINKFYPVRKVEQDGRKVYYSNDKQESLTVFDLYSIAWQISRALVYLKSEKITHRDIALRNILIDENKIIKLADFERAKKGETAKISITKTLMLKFKQPRNIPFSIYSIEAIKGFYFYSSEVFSFGKLLLDLFQFGAIPEISVESYIMRLKSAPDQPIECPHFVYDMIVGCMQFDAEKRPTIERCEGILDHQLREYSKPMYEELIRTLFQESEKDLLPDLPPSPYPPLPADFFECLEHQV